VIHLLFFHHAMNWDAGRGERLLKPFFKDTAVTCQQRNTDVFVTQLAARAQEKLVLAKAILSISKKASYEAVIGMRRDLHEEQTRPVSYKFPVKSGFTLTFHNMNAKCEFKWDGTNELMHIHPVVLWWMAARWHDEVVLEGHGTILHCQTKCRYQGPSDEHLYRAHPSQLPRNWRVVRLGNGEVWHARLLSIQDTPVLQEARSGGG
jgi:hypothetical protein